MKKYVSPEIEVTKVETADIMAGSAELANKEVDINVSGLMGYNPFDA